MTTIPLYGGPLKRDLIRRAYSLCGQSVTEFELTPEEYELGLLSANDLASTLGAGFGYNSPVYGAGSPDEESGLASGDVLGFTVMLAQEIAPNIGKSFSPTGKQATAKSALEAAYQIVPFVQMGRHTPRGAGNRYAGMAPFFSTPVSSDEPVQ